SRRPKPSLRQGPAASEPVPASRSCAGSPLREDTEMAFLPAELIKKKREDSPLSEEEIRFFIESYTRGEIPDYQMSALLMAIFFRGMNETETLALTKCMLHSGKTVDFSGVPGFKVDKHST